MKYYTTTKYNCGIDLHSKQMYVCIMDREGRILLHRNIRANDFAFFLKLAKPYLHQGCVKKATHRGRFALPHPPFLGKGRARHPCQAGRF